MTQDSSDTKKEEPSLYENEIAKLPQQYRDKVEAKKPLVDEIMEVISQKAQDKVMGFYINPQFEQTQDGGSTNPNFDKLTLSFLLDDFEQPINQFDLKILMGQDFDTYFVEEKQKDEMGQEYSLYKCRKDPSLLFEGNSISLLRENCFDSIYDDLKKLGNAVVIEDKRGFISALKTIDIHRNMLLQKFEKYVVVYAGAGSWLRGEKSNDFDVFVVVDDTDVKRMPRLQVKEQLSKIIWQMAHEVAQMTGIHIHAQIYLLTDFWDALKDAHPVMFTFLRDGVPFYDRGLYNSWKELLKLGKIRPSPEAIDMHMNVANQLLERANKSLSDIVMNDIYYAVLNPAQAILMLRGFNPTTPKETVHMFREVLLNKEKSVSAKDVSILEESVKLFKKIEHDKDTKIKGKDIDQMIKDAENFLKNMKKMFEEVTEEKTKESILSAYTELQTQIRTLPELKEIPEKDLLDTFEKEYVSTGKVSNFVKTSLESIKKAKQDYDEDKLTQTEVNKVLKEVRNVLADIKDYRDRNLLSELNNKKTTITYDDNKQAQLFCYEDTIYLVDSHSNTYEMKNNQFITSQKTTEEFVDASNFKQLQITAELFDAIKKTLQTQEIYL